jgi:hypothetical protein
MNVNWQSIMYLGGVEQLTSLPGILAQTPVPSATTTTPSETVVSPMTQFLTAAGLSSLGPTVLNLVGAIVILIVGWLIATVVAGVVKNLLKRTDLDNRLVRSVMGPGAGTEPKVENIISSVVFWIIIITTVVAFLNALQLTTVAQPLNGFLNQIFAFLPKLGGAAVLVGIAWVLATLAKTVVTRAARSFSLDEKVATQTDTQQSPENQFLLSETLGNVLYWFIFLFFLPLILGVLDLQGPLQPVQNLLNDILAALPRILKAVMIGVVGWVVARVVRGIVTNLLTATGVDRIGAQFGLRRTAGSQSLSWLLGTIVYVLILIPTAIAALDALQIAAISGPATSMLNQILNAIPQIFTAALILVLAYVVGRFAADLVRNLLAGIGFDNIFSLIGLGTPPAPPASPAPRVTSPPPTTQTTAPRVTSLPPTTQTTAPRREPTPPTAATLPTRTPSDIAGVVVLVGILLFAAIAATNVLNLPALTALVSGLLVVFGRVLVGLVIFAIGLYLSNLSFNLISSSGYAQAQTLGQAARIAIIALVSAMALQQMGVAPDIVNLAFGLLLGSIAIAIAIAFGLGGRAAAGKKLQEWSESFDRNKPPS